MRHTLGKLIFHPAAPLRMQSAVQRLMRGPRLETVRFRNGQLFDCYTSEKYFWFRDCYENDERKELEPCLAPDSVLYDIGAHAGFWEVVLAAKCHRIHAFEPSPKNFARLQRNILQNRLSNVVAVEAAASDGTATLRFVEDGTMSRASKSGSTGGSIEVESIALDEYVAQHDPPSVIKIDIEGHAGTALKGMRKTLGQRRPILFLEIHHREELDACHVHLDDLGYRFLPLGNTSSYPYRVRVEPEHNALDAWGAHVYITGEVR